MSHLTDSAEHDCDHGHSMRMGNVSEHGVTLRLTEGMDPSALIETQDLKAPKSMGVAKAVFGTDSAVWSNGGAGTALMGQAVTLTYTFQDVSWGANNAGEARFDAAQQAAALAVMQLWSNVANVTFTQGTAATAQIAFVEYDLPDGVAGRASNYMYNDDGKGSFDRITQSEVQMDTVMDGYAAGDWGFVTMIHEIGHALGLKHPGNYNAGGGGTAGPYLSEATDNTDGSVMSYNLGPHTSSMFPVSPMIYDITAMQAMYGANTGYHAGDDTYAPGGSGGAWTVWDGGGVDTLSAAGYGAAVTLDLREGQTTVTSIGASRLWLAAKSNVENATGGNANDTIWGNPLANVLIGNPGDDFIFGGQGMDTILGGMGNDKIIGGQGNDTLTGGSGVDIFYGASKGGTDHITDFVNGTDRLAIFSAALNDYLVTTDAAIATIIKKASAVEGGLRVAIGGQSFILDGFAKTDLDATDFLYV